MTFHLLSLILAGILSIADYITEYIFPEKIKKNQKLISFSAGVAIAYIILKLFPEISSSAVIEGKTIFLYALLGFVSLNLVEQYIYKGVENKKNSFTYHKSMHVAYFFIYNFFIGMILVNFASKGLMQAFLFFVPFLLYIIIKTLPQEFNFKHGTSKFLYSSASLFGAYIGIAYLEFTMSIFGELISFITGTLLYSVIRESLPSEKTERPLYFMLGVVFYALIIIAGWYLI